MDFMVGAIMDVECAAALLDRLDPIYFASALTNLIGKL